MTKFRESIRLKNYNYQNNGAYFVTICTALNKNLIAEKQKRILEEELKTLENRFDGVEIDYYTIMQNHVHIIFVFYNAAVRLPRVIQVFKSLSTRRLKKEGYMERVFWQRNYYEHIIRGKNTLNKIRMYIQNNPLVEKLDPTKLY
ncbi:MAG TPA: transposase [Candidatus Avalokitesvara rifleensis]|uniref:transposase n=1 Tax=Candidatus Avalokitesvara rifleensis TaxID=3367620 RepID=UPI0027134765|nr:transposase [Candidatus Brocadiales bacterium]